MHLSMYGRGVDPDLLQGKLDVWTLSHETAYATSLTYLKTHATAHLADMLRNRSNVACVGQPESAEGSTAKMLIGCWALDRNVCA